MSLAILPFASFSELCSRLKHSVILTVFGRTNQHDELLRLRGVTAESL
jgi:hypothetical protein